MNRVDARTAQRLLMVDETCARIARVVARGRAMFNQDEALFDACQLGIVRLNTDLERLGADWLAARPSIPREPIRGLRNRIGHDYHSVDSEILWRVVSVSVPEVHRLLAEEIAEARAAVFV